MSSASSAGQKVLGLASSSGSLKGVLAALCLTQSQAGAIRLAALDDSARFAYSGAVSVVSAMESLRAAQGSWATVKLYYSAFYFARAELSRAGVVVFHAPKGAAGGYSQYVIQARAGERPALARSTPSTHKLVARLLRQLTYPAYMTGLQIDTLDPFDWMMEQREAIQYRAGRFPDPSLPAPLSEIDCGRLDRHVKEYLNDDQGVFLSDPDHAMIALPLRMLASSLRSRPLLTSGIVDEDDVRFLRLRCRAGKPALSSLSHLIK